MEVIVVLWIGRNMGLSDKSGGLGFADVVFVTIGFVVIENKKGGASLAFGWVDEVVTAVEVFWRSVRSC